MSLGSFYSSGGLAGLYRKAPDRPSREFVAAMPTTIDRRRMHQLPEGCDDVARQFGPRVYRAMLTDAAVRSSFDSLRLSILDCGVNLIPTHKAPASARRPKPMLPKPEPGAHAGMREDGESGPTGLTPEQSRAKDVAEFCERTLARFDAALGVAAIGLLDGMAFGVKVAETTLGPIESGPDKGMLGVASFRVKPDWAWRFQVDRAMNVTGIVTWDDESGSYLVIDPAKFSWFSWLPQDNDPRGTSVLRAAYDSWNQKIQHWTDYYKFLKRFASPGLVGVLPENDREPKIDIDSDGNEVTDGTTISPGQHMVKVLQCWQNGGVASVSFGSTLEVLEPKTSGESFLTAFDFFDRQICLAIQLQARTSLEAKHSSKADGDTAQDTKGLVVAYGRKVLAEAIRRMLRFVVTANFGPEDAAEYTPKVELGKAEQQDKSLLWGAAGTLFSSGYLGESQKEELDAEIGLPPRDPEADARAAAEKLKAQQEIAAASAPKGGPPGQDGKAKPGEPKPADGKPQPNPGEKQ